MKMTGLEKLFVNRERKGKRNIARLREQLDRLDMRRFFNALELGCGPGWVSAFLAEHYRLKIVGSDYDPEEIRLARSLHRENDRLRFRVEDATDLSFTHNLFDLVISQNVFHHVADWPQAVREVARVLRPDGYFIWFDLHVPAVLKKFLRPLGKRHGLYTLDDMRSMLAANGLEEKFQGRAAHGPIPHHEIVAFKPPLAARID